MGAFDYRALESFFAFTSFIIIYSVFCKESITLSMELAKTQSHEFECFEDNYSRTVSTQGCRINHRRPRRSMCH